ncbi:MAG: histidine--tRNA ligase [Patescibacteria group bacterium]|nr:histidine--tRNA ligase [Patescibacteria group bacterium]MDD5715713.1 histidine--tRNA ligase [Patescibacteria group bacterium]
MPKEEAPKKTAERPKKQIQLLRGMKDVLPEEQQYWDFIQDRLATIAQAYGFGLIKTPLIEETGLFVRSVGKDTDIVEKEMYTFQDKGGESVSLAPEGTASVVRAYIEHGMLSRPQPVKLFYIGPFFRYDRPQAGRYRQFYQFGFEVIGERHPVIDAQLMMLAYNFYAGAKLPVSLQVNSIGSPESRADYRKALIEYYKSRKNSLCEDCRQRLQKNPMRLLDCKVPDCQVLAQDAPQIIDHLDEESNKHFVQVLEHLDEVEIPYVLNSRLVRGLDYYTGTVFEIWPEPNAAIAPGTDGSVKQSAQSALGGGGRYDTLVETLGGQPTPAIGYAGGIERCIIELKDRAISIGAGYRPELFIAQLGALARKKALKLFEDLRQAGFKVAESFAKDGLKPQMELANKLGTKYALIIGQKEMMDGTILIRDMESGIQETVDFQKITAEVRKRLEKYGVVEKRDGKIPTPSADQAHP